MVVNRLLFKNLSLKLGTYSSQFLAEVKLRGTVRSNFRELIFILLVCETGKIRIPKKGKILMNADLI
jgi:hypothetical protein